MKLKNIRLPEGLLNIINTTSAFALPVVVGTIGGLLVGSGIGALANYDFSLAEQSKETYEAVKNYAEIGAGVGTGIGVIIDMYILSKLYKERT